MFGSAQKDLLFRNMSLDPDTWVRDVSVQTEQNEEGQVHSRTSFILFQGNILLNDNMARLIERFMMFNDGMAYGIDQVLEPPGLGAHCDGVQNKTTYVSPALDLL